MSFGVCRVQKVKGAAAVVGLQIHDRREREHSNTNPDIDRERSKDNYFLIDTPDKSFNTLSGAAVQCYTAQNEADKLRHEVAKLKNSYYGERYKKLKHNYDKRLQEISNLQNESRDLN